MPEVAASEPRWLLLVHQLPARPSNLRVHVWRRLQQVGAVALRNSIYVLPNTPDAREDFEWIRAEITGRGGQVSILAGQAIDGYTDDELAASFRKARNDDYASLITGLEKLAKRLAGRTQRLSRTAIQREIAKARERFHALKTTDFFGATRASDAQAALERLEEMLQPQPSPDSTTHLDARLFRRRQWLTRPHPGIDRMSSAWLIRRFIAPDAKFVFGSLPAVDDQVPFDMPNVEFGHHGSDCTYETLARRFAISDEAAIRIGHLVHDLDLKESRYGLPETTTIGRLVDGLRDAASDDHALLEDGIRMIEALHRSFTREAAPPKARASRARTDRQARRKRAR